VHGVRPVPPTPFGEDDLASAANLTRNIRSENLDGVPLWNQYHRSAVPLRQLPEAGTAARRVKDGT
jgi:hypothetical protein